MLARFGDIYIVSVPISQLMALSLDPRVLRIEAGRGTQTLTDSVALHVNALPVYEGRQLPQAYSGTGTVVGVMDIGFDLTLTGPKALGQTQPISVELIGEAANVELYRVSGNLVSSSLAPTLTAADCIDIFSRTCSHPDATLTYPNNLYDYGQIDVYASLLEVLRCNSTGLASVLGFAQGL